jgi:hypothetical protein
MTQTTVYHCLGLMRLEPQGAKVGVSVAVVVTVHALYTYIIKIHK